MASELTSHDLVVLSLSDVVTWSAIDSLSAFPSVTGDRHDIHLILPNASCLSHYTLQFSGSSKPRRSG